MSDEEAVDADKSVDLDVMSVEKEFADMPDLIPAQAETKDTSDYKWSRFREQLRDLPLKPGVYNLPGLLVEVSEPSKCRRLSLHLWATTLPETSPSVSPAFP